MFWDGLEAMSYEIKPLAEERKHVEKEEAWQRGDIVFGVVNGVAQVEEQEKGAREKDQ